MLPSLSRLKDRAAGDRDQRDHAGTMNQLFFCICKGVKKDARELMTILGGICSVRPKLTNMLVLLRLLKKICKQGQ